MLQVKQASRQSVWPALCALGASALAAYAVVAWFLQIQSLQSPATQVPVVLSVASGNVSSDGNADAHVAFALGAPKPAGKDTGNSAQAAHQWNFLGVVASASGQGAALIGVGAYPGGVPNIGGHVPLAYVWDGEGNEMVVVGVVSLAGQVVVLADKVDRHLEADHHQVGTILNLLLVPFL